MLLRRFTDFILQNRVHAMGTAFVIAFIPFVGSISILIAALVTLRKNMYEGALVTLAATAPYVISYFVSTPTVEQAQIAELMLGVVILSNLFTWLFASMLQKFGIWNVVIELGIIIGVGVIALVYLIYPDVQNWWAIELTNYFARTNEVLAKLKTEVSSETLKAAQAEALSAINTLKHFATGFLVTSILTNALLQLGLARWWQAALFNPGALRKELYQIRLGYIASFIFVIGFILAYFGIDFAIDMMPVLCMAFFVAGLSLLHSFISLTKLSWLWLVFIYLGIFWLLPLSVIVIALVALLDSGLDFRKRFLL